MATPIAYFKPTFGSRAVEFLCSSSRCESGIPVTVEWYRRSLRGIEHQFIFVRVVSRGVSEATKSPELALSRSREELLPGANLIYYTTKRRELKLFSKEL